MLSLNNKKKKKSGFTLTEILVVVLIISVLAAVVYPLYTKAVTKSRAIEAINLLEMVRNKQIQKYARDNYYFSEFDTMGQLTSNLNNEESLSGGAQLRVKDYTLSLNNATKCMSAGYSKGSSTFKFSTSYENAGLGCTGNICTSFGDIIGDAKSVCNCGAKECSGGFVLNEDTCNCDCHKVCNDGTTCKDMSGGGLSRPCTEGCGTQYSMESCNGSVWSGKCWIADQKQPTSQRCGKNNSGTQTRSCSPTCEGGSCGDWGQCTGQVCPDSEKPDASASCGKCGTKTQSITCDPLSGNWQPGGFGACTGEGICSPGETAACGNEGTKTCTSGCGWGACTGEKIECVGEKTQACGNCGTQDRTCDRNTGKWNIWGECTAQGECAVNATQACGDGNGTQQCSPTCGWNTCACNTGYTWDSATCTKDPIPCNESEKPAITKSCGTKCGTETGTLDCDTSIGKWNNVTWSGTCASEGECAANATQSCGGGNGLQLCSSTCGWATCACNTGYTWDGNTCVKDKIECNESEKPIITKSCGSKCGSETGTVECDTSTGKWGSVVWSGTCGNEGTCVPYTDKLACGDGNGFQFCTDKCEYAVCTCAPGFKWTGSTCESEVKWTTEFDMMDTIISACSSYGGCPTSICNGSVTTRSIYTEHQLRRCEYRAKGNSHGLVVPPSEADGSPCDDVNWYSVNGDGKAEEASCSGGTSSPPDCSNFSASFDEACRQKGYEGILCVSTYYSKNPVKINSYPCLQDGIQCRYMGGGVTDWKRLATKGAASVYRCVRR